MNWDFEPAQDEIEKAREMLLGASRICVLTGAGISQESGVPTFRGADGLWKQFRAEELATPEAFYSNPRLVWEWYDWRRQLIANAEPNAGHYALKEMEDKKEGFTLITQNVDGLHRKAGSRNVIELHGNIWEIRCTVTGEVEENHEVPLKEIPPRCTKTGKMARPNVVWFGEIVPHELISRSLRAIEECDLMLIVGTSGLVQPASYFGIAAKRNNKPVIEINLDPTPNTGLYDLSIRGKSGKVLPLIV